MTHFRMYASSCDFCCALGRPKAPRDLDAAASISSSVTPSRSSALARFIFSCE